MKIPRFHKIFSKTIFRLLNESGLESAEGDVMEEYERIRIERGSIRALRFYLIEIIGLIFNHARFPSIKFSHEIKLGIRSIRKNPGHSILSAFGLALGMSVGLLVLIFFLEQNGLDSFHKRKGIERIITEYPDHDRKLATTPYFLNELIRKETESKVVTLKPFSAELLTGRNSIGVKGLYTSAEFLELFDFPLLAGNNSLALSDPSQIVISESLASQIFQGENALGKEITLELQPGNKIVYLIAGVVKNLTSKSHLKFQILVPGLFENDWSAYTYYLNPGIDKESLKERLNAQAQIFLNPELPRPVFEIQTLDEIISGNTPDFEISEFPNRNKAWTLIKIAAVLMIIAIFNFVSFSISRAIKKIKEIAVKKINGATRLQLISQFMIESVLISFLSLLISIPVLILLVSMFNGLESTKFSDAAITFQDDQTLPFLVLFIAFPILLGLISGFYPALYLSSHKPLGILRNKNLSVSPKLTLRKVLLSIQLIVTVILVSATFVELLQFQFMTNIDYGFRRDNILNVTLKDAPLNLFKNEANRLPFVQGVSGSEKRMIVDGTSSAVFSINSDKQLQARYLEVDPDFLLVHEIDLAAGRFYSKGNLKEIIVNAGFARLFGFEEPVDLVGESVRMDSSEYLIVGIVDEFQHGRVDRFNRSEPFALVKGSNFNFAQVKVSEINPNQINQLGSIWRELDREHSFEYSWLDVDLRQKMNRKSEGISTIGLLALFTILTACIGLIGLVSSETNARMKEVAIRKIMGSSVRRVLMKLNLSYWKLVGFALLIALPASFFIAGKILQEYPYRVEIDLWIFVGLGFAVLLLVTTAISFKTYKAACSNPLRSINEE